MSSINIHLSYGINPRDTASTHLYRANRSLSRNSKYIIYQQTKLNDIQCSFSITDTTVKQKQLQILTADPHKHAVNTTTLAPGTL